MKFKEIKLLYKYILSIGIFNAKLIKYFDGYAIIFVNTNKDIVQHSFVPGAISKGYVELAIGNVRDYTSIPLSLAKDIVFKNRNKLVV